MTHRVDRRAFLHTAAGASAAALGATSIGCRPRALESRSDGLASTGPQLALRMPASLTDASGAELDLDLHVISGTLPPLVGHALTVAAIPNTPDAFAFNGDGMIYRLDFGGGRVHLRTRLAKTPSYFADQAVRGTDHAFRNAGIVRISPSLGTCNQANTAFLPMGNRLLVTYDAGRPYEVDPQRLELVTPVGANSEWTPSLSSTLFPGPLPTYLSTAHPYYDNHTGEVFSVNYAPPMPGSEPFTALLRWDGAGALEKWRLMLPDGKPVQIAQSIHQIAVTQDYVVVMDTAFVIEPEQIFGGSKIRPQAPDTAVYLVRRGDLHGAGGEVEARRVVIPREAVHFLADYDNPDHRITLYLAHNCASDASEWLRRDDVLATSKQPVRIDLRGAPSAPMDINVVGRHVIDARSAQLVGSEHLIDDDFTWGTALYTFRGQAPPGQLPRIYWVSYGFSEELLTQRVFEAYQQYKHRRVPITELPLLGRPTTLFALDTHSMGLADGYRFPPGRVVGSPQFVPGERGGDDPTTGYIVCTVVSDDTRTRNSSGDEFWVFDAADLSQGPLCRLGHPELNLGFTLHTCWMPEIAPRTAEYAVDVHDDYAELLARQPDEIQKLFAEQVLPQFARQANG